MIKGAKLQLKLLSNSGELLNVVNCPAGKITVLRAYNTSQLEPYKSAVCGIPGKERIIITIDGQEFVASEHELIGFGDELHGLPTTVNDFLLDSGISEAALDSILLSFGLKEVASKSFANLNSCQARRVRILAATYQNDKAIVINNPFEPLASEWRERFAELLLAYVEADNVPLLITSLEYRPESWINNENIVRVQVGENSQRTIGFGSGPSEFENLIKQVRSNQSPKSISKSETNSGTSLLPPINTGKNVALEINAQNATVKSSKTSRKQKKQYGIHSLFRNKAVKSLSATLLVLFVAALILLQNQKRAEHSVVAVINESLDAAKASEQSVPQNNLQASGSQNNEPKTQTALLPQPVSQPEPDPVLIAAASDKGKPFVPPKTAPDLNTVPVPERTADERPILRSPKRIDQDAGRNLTIFALDRYGPELKKSIMASFQGDESARAAHLQYASLSKANRTVATKPKTATNDSILARDLLRALKTTDGSGAKLPDSPTSRFTTSTNPAVKSLENRNYQDLSRDERRTLLREKFREAIERASQNRQE